ncbi:response regulator transcription factor [Brevundimonas sp.]|uniref:response regulator transcription factor n=1 Tax=Brevundimonas sp. TaxID=1871086 RepID=UPI002BBA0041|nr:response regulator [Brevundimonas sp.]HWQ86598.1 response regulator [Brevundimonas sp.]
MSRGRVFVIDDDTAVLASLEAVLDVAGFDVTIFRSSRAFLGALDEVGFGCVVTDVRMPDLSGLALVERLTASGRRHWPVIVISGHADVPMAVAAMKAGACTVLEKPISPPALVEMIDAAFAARSSVSGPATEDADAAARLGSLSRREREVLSHLVNGASSKVAALVLGISPRTVDVFRGNILRKTRAPNVAALATLAAKGGWFSGALQ